jgi:hypothetical protein
MKRPNSLQALGVLLVLQASCFGEMVASPGPESAMPSLTSNGGALAANPGTETTAESVAKLSDLTVILYALPLTAGGSAIGPENCDLPDIRAIMSNPRFLKSFEELQKLDQAAAAEIVKTNLSSALSKYLPEYNASLRVFAPHYKISDTTNQFHGGIGFALTGPTNDPGKEVLPGLRLKILSLVWMSGLLNLTNNKEAVEQIARVAIKQRKELYDDPTLTTAFKFTMQHTASLYNRQILSSGLLGVTFNGNGLETNAMNAAGIQWQQRTAPNYGALLMGPVQSAPDYFNSGNPSLNCVSQMSDTNFDILLKEIGFKP